MNKLPDKSNFANYNIMGIGGMILVMFYSTYKLLDLGFLQFLGGVLIASSFILHGFLSEVNSDMIRLFRAAGLVKDEQLPKIIKETETDDGFIMEISMPAGVSVSDFENKKEAIEQYLRGEVNFAFNKNLIMTVNKKPLHESYKFTLQHYDEPLKIAFAHSRSGIYGINIEEAPHIIIAGTTGAGKSVLLRCLITALILDKSPSDVELRLVDFMRVELGIFKNSEFVKEFCCAPENFNDMLFNLADESERRLLAFEEKNVVNIQSYNKKYPQNKMKYIVVIVDEFASLAEKCYKHVIMSLKTRIAQDRKCGIHYILCTQRPSTDIIDGTIKANIPVRICLKTSSGTDSSIVLDERGSERLRGKGHAIIKSEKTTELQTMFLSEAEARKLIKHTLIKKEYNGNVANVNNTTKDAGVMYRVDE